MTTEAYQRTLHGASLFDISTTGKLEVSGPEAPAYLHNLCTNDISGMPLGAGCEAYFCNARARALFHTRIYHVKLGTRHAFWVDVTPGYDQALLQHLDKHLIAEQVELANRTDAFGMLHLAGPQAREVLSQALSEVVPELPEFYHMERTFGSQSTVHIRRHDPLGVPGYDIVMLKDRFEGVRRILEATGAKLGDDETFETLRIENATPVYGKDVDENRFVMEVSRALRAVCYTKGCYLGQEPIVMARDRAGKINRALMGVKVLEGGPLPKATKLFLEEKEVGITMSATESPRLGAPLSLAYLAYGHQEAGLKLIAKTEAGNVPVEVLPFPPLGG